MSASGIERLVREESIRYILLILGEVHIQGVDEGGVGHIFMGGFGV